MRWNRTVTEPAGRCGVDCISWRAIVELGAANEIFYQKISFAALPARTHPAHIVQYWALAAPCMNF